MRLPLITNTNQSTKLAAVLSRLATAVILVGVAACTASPGPAPTTTALVDEVTTASSQGATTSTQSTQTSTTVGVGDIAYQEYVKTALEIMEGYFYASDQVEWSDLHQQVLERLAADSPPEQAYEALGHALAQLGDPHSRFVPPQVQEGTAQTVQETSAPFGERMGQMGYLNLPAIRHVMIDPDDPRAYADTVNELLEELDTPEPACGWIIDLRENRGGTILPMFASLGPLLGHGVVLTATGPSGTETIEVGEDFSVSYSSDVEDPVDDYPLLEPLNFTGSASQDTQAYLEALRTPSEPVYRPEIEDPPVAVLTSSTTASAGEYVTVAFLGRDNTQTFGGITRGVPTGVRSYQFVDGGVLHLARAAPSDRLGRTYTTHINPDNFVADDQAIEAAVHWLTMQPPCH